VLRDRVLYPLPDCRPCPAFCRPWSRATSCRPWAALALRRRPHGPPRCPEIRQPEPRGRGIPSTSRCESSLRHDSSVIPGDSVAMLDLARPARAPEEGPAHACLRARPSRPHGRPSP
jgi:hypothetical protein